MTNEELQHYGVLGMKWGQHRIARKTARNEKLRKRALKYDKKSAVAAKKSEKAHAEYDLESSNKAAKKAANYKVKAAKLEKRALKETDEIKKSKYEAKAAKASYKSSVQQMKANQISKTKGYGAKAMKESIKSDKMARKAAKARMAIAQNESYIKAMNKKLSEASDQTVKRGRSYLGDTTSN